MKKNNDHLYHSDLDFCTAACQSSTVVYKTLDTDVNLGLN